MIAGDFLNERKVASGCSIVHRFPSPSIDIEALPIAFFIYLLSWSSLSSILLVDT